uniref:Uncharacterized protein n=1 Tax=CrAss-like virus sp. ctRQZ5 TaxID=2826824 RepID=A0A8S5LXR1_9CAUD|nr:MAG TPA: hypothetical protein [CrAss-like virus sp. ctRQZ5]
MIIIVNKVRHRVVSISSITNIYSFSYYIWSPIHVIVYVRWIFSIFNI